MKVRKKPVTVDAWKVDDLLNLAEMGAGALPEEVRAAYLHGTIDIDPDRITVATLEGVMIGWSGWWLIRGIKGEWYPCDGDIFEQTYEFPHATIAPTTLLGVPTPYDANPEG